MKSELNTESRIYLSLYGLFLLGLITQIPTLPNERPTLAGVILWAGLVGFALGHLTLGVAQAVKNYWNNTRK